jgi:hypothetical protein
MGRICAPLAGYLIVSHLKFIIIIISIIIILYQCHSICVLVYEIPLKYKLK